MMGTYIFILLCSLLVPLLHAAWTPRPCYTGLVQGHDMEVIASCQDDGIEVRWRPLSGSEVELVQIEYTCHNGTGSSDVIVLMGSSLTTSGTKRIPLSAIQPYGTSDIECVVSGCFVEGWFLENYAIPPSTISCHYVPDEATNQPLLDQESTTISSNDPSNDGVLKLTSTSKHSSTAVVKTSTSAAQSTALDIVSPTSRVAEGSSNDVIVTSSRIAVMQTSNQISILATPLPTSSPTTHSRNINGGGTILQTPGMNTTPPQSSTGGDGDTRDRTTTLNIFAAALPTLVLVLFLVLLIAIVMIVIVVLLVVRMSVAKKHGGQHMCAHVTDVDLKFSPIESKV